ncbi:MAG: c-type cytochrome [Proteobacteria bacterium]|nr:c-type cytochrome [Pseudomonadota bacterium]
MKILYLTITIIFILVSGYSYAANGDPENGKALSQICATCHSVDGNSVNPVWPKLAGQHATYIVKQLVDFKDGRRVNAQMTPMVAPLSEQDMEDLAAYFASQNNKQGSARPEFIELGQRIYRSGDNQSGIPACLACHGPVGVGNPAALYPLLSGQHAEYTSTQLKMFKTEERNNDVNNVMRTIAGPMTNAQIEAVSEYIQGLH